ncbi:zinc ribbon domain-containing protein [Liquorilactobacillus capillatus]|uniref:zinc ribbon domain-containing protein n=1 Tax=Liquorilactobacillus capillatus TaxID=480931 RepID=UPI00070B4C01|nr:zinc ribbon domain-containing protein [Liquorilactobacillus capillatus]
MKLAYDMVTCQSCGVKVTVGRYCSNCGTQLIFSSEKKEVEVNICVNCGALTPNDEYCSVCGFHTEQEVFF